MRLRLVAQLQETRAWLAQESPLRAVGEQVARHSRLHRESDEAIVDDIRGAATRAFAARRTLIRGAPDTASATPGRVLLFLPDVNLMDGAAQSASGGLFGELNVPVVDLWVDLVDAVLVGAPLGPALVCWVPGALVASAQRGIDVNPEGCLLWAADAWPDLESLVRQLQ